MRWPAVVGRLRRALASQPDDEHGLPTAEDDIPAGRHRAEPSVASRATSGLAVATAGLVGTALLGWFTADLVGLTDGPAPVVAYEAPAPSIQPRLDPAEPTLLRTLDITGTPTRPSDEPSPSARTTAAARPAVAATAERADDPVDEPSPEPVRIATVRPGDPCSGGGVTARTKSGDPMVCTASRGNGPTRWRRA